MWAKFLILLLLGSTASISALVSPRLKIESDYSKLLMNSLSSVQNNPNRYAECFNFYNPLIRDAGDVYEQEVVECNNIAEKSRLDINANEKVIAGKTEVQGMAESVCSNLQSCNNDSAALDFFQCYAAKGNDGSQESSSVKYKANENLEMVQALIVTIDTQENMCVNAASEKYNSKISTLSDELQNCFKTDYPLNATVAPTETVTP